MTVLLVGAGTAGRLANRPLCTPNPSLMGEVVFYCQGYCHILIFPGLLASRIWTMRSNLGQRDLKGNVQEAV